MGWRKRTNAEHTTLAAKFVQEQASISSILHSLGRTAYALRRPQAAQGCGLLDSQRAGWVVAAKGLVKAVGGFVLGCWF
jgi:hypothetical protein